MPDNKSLIKDLDYLSSQISIIVRTLNFGILVFIWSLLFTTISTLETKIASYSIILVWIAIFVVASLLFDFLQYIFAFVNTKYYQKKLELNGENIIKFDESKILYKMRNYMFYGKQILTVFGVFGLLFVLYKIVSF